MKFHSRAGSPAQSVFSFPLLFLSAAALTFLSLIPASALAGSQTYSTPGTHSFTVPSYGTLTVTVIAGGGGGAGGYAGCWVNCDPASVGHPGGDAGNVSFGSVTAYGGKGGLWVSSGGQAGGASGGDQNITGGGSSGGVGGTSQPTYSGSEDSTYTNPGSRNGGAGGKAIKTYGYGALTPGSTVTVVIGTAIAPPYYYGIYQYANQGFYEPPQWTQNGGRGGNGGSTYCTVVSEDSCPPSDAWGPGDDGTPGGNGSVTVTWTNAPLATCSVSLSPNPINQGNGSTLTWSSSNADSWVYINNVGYVPSTGSAYVAPSSSTDYSCYAQGSGGSDGWHSAVLTVRASCSLPWSGTIQNGQSTIAYQAATVAYGSSCSSQTRICSDGTLSGSYLYQSCSVNPPANCTLNGVTIPHGGSRTFYSVQTAPSGQLCSAYTRSRTCTNGSLSGSSSYQYASCSCAPSHYCSSNTITYRNSSCADVVVTTCISPAYCSNGVAACLYPSPSFNATGDLSGHLQLRPLLVRSGDTVRAYWNVSNVEGCTVSSDNGDSWIGASSGTSGKTTSALTQRTTFTLTCTGLDNSTLNESAVVNMVPVFNEN